MTKRKDQMTSNERLGAYFEGKEVDRLPAMPMIDSVGPRLMGQKCGTTLSRRARKGCLPEGLK